MSDEHLIEMDDATLRRIILNTEKHNKLETFKMVHKRFIDHHIDLIGYIPLIPFFEWLEKNIDELRK